MKQALNDDYINEVSINSAKFTLSTSLQIKNKDALDCTFMHTKIFKEILFIVDFDEQHTQSDRNWVPIRPIVEHAYPFCWTQYIKIRFLDIVFMEFYCSKPNSANNRIQS